MALMEWSDDLDVGVEDMNDQHKQILKYMNELYDLAETDKDFKNAENLISKLGEVTVKHFREEEVFMEQTDYKAFDAHKQIHEDLLKKFTGHVDRMGAKGELDHEFFSFLKLWLSAHIKGLDKRYGENANKNAA